MYLDESSRKRLKELEEIARKNANYNPIILTENGYKLASELNNFEKAQEVIKCKLDPKYFIETYLTIFDQTKGDGGEIVPFKLFEYQKRIIDDYKKYRNNITNKYRQAGISTITCGYIALYISFEENKSVAIVADKLETARDELMRDVVQFIEQCPDWLVPHPDTKDTQKHKVYSNGSEIRAFSSKGLRGYTPTLLFWDEVAHTEKAAQFWDSTRPALQTGGKAIFVSCVTKDSFIFTDKGIKQVQEFIPDNIIDGANFIDDTYLLGTHKKRKTNIFYNNGFVDTLKINTTYSSLESSKNHKYWAYKNGKYDWFKAEDLEVGDFISIQKGAEIWGNNDDCSDFSPHEKYVKHKFKPKKITEDIAYLIGLYISEGYIYRSKNRKNGSNLTLTCGDNLNNILNKLNLKYSLSKDGLHYTISSIQLVEFFEYLGFDITKKAPEKYIPSRVLEMSRNNIISMIQGIMDGNGYASFNEKMNMLRIGIGLSSKKLIDQLRIIFNNFGILTEYGEYITHPTKKVKVTSKIYRLTINNRYSEIYKNKINFRFNRKKIITEKYGNHKKGHIGVKDNIPNGVNIIKEIYEDIKCKGKLKELNESNIKIDHILHKKLKTSKVSRFTILKLINKEKENISDHLLKKYEYILNENIVWTQIKSIDKSKNYTYDFSISNDNPTEFNEHNMSLIYNGFITHQTPNGYDPVYFKTFDQARKAKRGHGKSNFNAIEIYWFNDPRFNQDLEWVRNKGKTNEIRIKDENFDFDKRIKLNDDGWEATSPWFEDQIIDYGGDMQRLNQELRGSFLGSGDNFFSSEALERIETEEIDSDFRQEYLDNQFYIWEDPEPDAEYVITVDVSAGHGDDYSSINIIKVEDTTIERKVKDGLKTKKVKKRLTKQVGEYYNKIKPQELAVIVYQYAVRYNNGLVVVDISNGYGAIVIEKLFDDYEYENVHYSEVSHKPTRDRLNGYIRKKTKVLPDGSSIEVDLVAGFYIGANRGAVLIEFQRVINMKETIIKSVRLHGEMKTFITVTGNRVADHRRSFHDDSLMGYAIGIYVVNFHMEDSKEQAKRTKKLIDAMKRVNSNQESTVNGIGRANPYGNNSWLFPKR